MGRKLAFFLVAGGEDVNSGSVAVSIIDFSFVFARNWANCAYFDD